MATPLSGYYNRFNEADNYDEHHFRAGYVLQSAEMNEIQSALIHRTKALGDALFKDGDIVRDARLVVDLATGNTTCESGAVYLRGAVRGVPSATITIPTVGTVAIGIWLMATIVTQNEDPNLRDPAAETRNYQEPGAGRLKVEPKWGHRDDGTVDGEFFPIYYADDGLLRAKEAPPQLDSVSQAIAKYDLDSTGSSYVVEGLRVTQLANSGDNQVYNVENGRARINGFGVTLTSSRRVVYPATPVLRFIDSEPRSSDTASAHRVNLDRTPVASIQQIRITANKTASLNHGTFSGAQDPLPDTSVVEIVSVTQGATTYVNGVDYKLTAGRVDWSLSGAEPAPGSTYSAQYNYITSVEPTDVDDTGYTVTGAVPGTLIMTSYNVKLPRIDRLVMDQQGMISWVTGVSTDYNPVPPQAPGNVIALAQVFQTWTTDRKVVSDGVRMVSMTELESMNARMDNITALVAKQLLMTDIGTRNASVKKGLFVDPFLDDEQRDQGIKQSASIFSGVLTLPIDGDALAMPADVGEVVTCDFVLETALEQPLCTGSMKINPYMAFALMPALVKLTPAVDRWTETETAWTSPVTQRFNQTFNTSSFESLGLRTMVTTSTGSSSSTSTRTIGTSTSEIQYLRPIEVQFEAQGFGPGEELSSITFDGLAVTATA